MILRYVGYGIAVIALTTSTIAQDFPNRTIRIVSTDAGGGNDFVARILATGLSANLPHPVIVENRGGANGIIAAQTVVKAPPDGHALLNYSSGLWIVPLMQSVPYDPIRDFAPISRVVASPNVLVVHASLPVKSVKDLIALAKSRPGELNYSTGASGSTPHLAAELFKSMAGVDIQRIPYKNSGAALNALLTGEAQLIFATAGPLGPHLKSGRLRGLAVTSAQPSPLAPGLPAIAATLPGFEAESVFGIFAPAKTPIAVVSRINQELVRVLNNPDVKEKFANAGILTVGSSPEQFAAMIKSEMASMGKVIKDVGIKAE